MLVCWWRWFDWSFAHLIAPVVITTFIILSCNKIQTREIQLPANPGPPGKMVVKVVRECDEKRNLEDECKVVGNIVCSPWWLCCYHLDYNTTDTPHVTAAAIAFSTQHLHWNSNILQILGTHTHTVIMILFPYEPGLSSCPLIVLLHLHVDVTFSRDAGHNSSSLPWHSSTEFSFDDTSVLGYWHQRADERQYGIPPPR